MHFKMKLVNTSYIHSRMKCYPTENAYNSWCIIIYSITVIVIIINNNKIIGVLQMLNGTPLGPDEHIGPAIASLASLTNGSLSVALHAAGTTSSSSTTTSSTSSSSTSTYQSRKGRHIFQV